jgi:hypothetical protein
MTETDARPDEGGRCRWKFGEAAPVCDEPAVTTYHVRLPAEVVPGVVIADDEREQDVPVCEKHLALIESLHKPSVFKQRTSAKSGLPIEDEHKQHREWVAGCLGCAYDFDPPWDRR